MTLTEAAAALPELMLSKFGMNLPIDQIDLEQAEDGRIAAYVYDAAGNCAVLFFEKPEPFIAADVREVLLQQRVIH